MKIKSAEFEISAPDLRSCPTWALPEFAFIGRSNVGKSSLINMLTERCELAKVSDAPGKTQLINFFVINGSLCLVDLPGYGFAAVARHMRNEFNDSVAGFLSGRRNLRCVFVLIDPRLPPQAIDIDFLQWLDGEGVHFALIFTKIDELSSSKLRDSVEIFKKAVGEWRADVPECFASSSKTRSGRTEILGCIEAVLTKYNRGKG